MADDPRQKQIESMSKLEKCRDTGSKSESWTIDLIKFFDRMKLTQTRC
jgi:hypothetical protein